MYTVCSQFAICSFLGGGYCPKSISTVLIRSCEYPILILFAAANIMTEARNGLENRWGGHVYADVLFAAGRRA